MADGSQPIRGEKPAPALAIRVAVMEDLDELMEIAVLATAENGFAKPSHRKLLETVYGVVSGQIPGMVGIIGPEGSTEIEGVVLLCIGTAWYTDEPGIEERVIWVRPNLRSAKGARGKRLAEFAKKVSDELGLPLIIGVLSNQRTAAKVKMYTRIFGQPAGAYFLYGVTTGEAG